MAMHLNFAPLVVAFLCLDQPIVINVMAKILINGCSKDVNLIAESLIFPSDALPNGETKYKINPISNCICVTINPTKAIFLSFTVNSFLELIPKKEFMMANTNNNKTTYAQPE
jgi:hypothetical protein